MFGKPVAKITCEDIEALVANEVSEGRTLEYKQSLPGGNDDARKEFLADVSSFANAVGGHILFGVTEQRDSDGHPTGIPEVATGLGGVNADKEILRLDQMVRSGIEPRMSGFRLRAIPGFKDGPVLLAHIPRSTIGPHVVSFRWRPRFYSRASNGKYPMDLVELRSAFAAAAGVSERVRSFRDDRLARIAADETPIPLRDCPRIALHLVAWDSLTPGFSIDLIQARPPDTMLKPIETSGYSPTPNFDGYLVHNKPHGGERGSAYTQVFRNGMIEAVEAGMLLPEAEGRKIIYGAYCEKRLVEGGGRYLDAIKTLGLHPPVFVLLSFVGVRGYVVTRGGPRYHGFGRDNPIDRDTLILPDVEMQSFEEGFAKVMKPAFDVLWQTSGAPGSPSYDSDGNWKPLA